MAIFYHVKKITTFDIESHKILFSNLNSQFLLKRLTHATSNYVILFQQIIKMYIKGIKK